MIAFKLGGRCVEKWKSGKWFSTRDYYLYLRPWARALVLVRIVLLVANEGAAILPSPLNLPVFVSPNRACERCVGRCRRFLCGKIGSRPCVYRKIALPLLARLTPDRC